MEPPITVGMRVLSVSGILLGEVGAVSEGRFLLRTVGDDAWIRRDAVFTVDEGRVTLVCNENGVKRYIVPG